MIKKIQMPRSYLQSGSFLSPQIFCSLSLSSLACPDPVGWRDREVEQGRAAGLRLLEHLHVGQAVEQDVDDGGPLLRSTLAVLPCARPPRRPPPAGDLQGNPLLRATPTADQGRTQRQWLDLLTVFAPLRHGHGALLTTSHSECETRLDGMAAAGRRTAYSRTNR
jgi:hypothetical protein